MRALKVRTTKVGFGKRFAKGKYAKAECPLCGLNVPYKELVWDYRGQIVCKDCNDDAPWYYDRKIYNDPQALEHARPTHDTFDGTPAPTDFYPEEEANS
jgi:hypothetical protein